MKDNRYQIVYRHGIALDRWTAQLWDKLVARFPNLILTQGVKSGAPASGGTHLGLGVLDLYLNGHNWKDVLHYAFNIGFFGWYRPAIPGLWKTHIHLGVRGNAMMAPSLKIQQVSWTNRRNGLKGNGADFYDYRPANYKQTAPYVTPILTTITAALLNLPAPGVGSGKDLPNPTGRIAAAMRMLRKNSIHIIAWNELGRVKSAGGGDKPSIASDFAHDTDAALGSGMRLVMPTRNWNENYLSYQSASLEVVHQYDDSILESGSGGRHLLRVVLRHKNHNKVFAVGVLQLVNGHTSMNEKDRQKQAVDAYASMAAVSAKHGDCPFVILGDVNTAKDLTGFTGKGMKRARKYADKSDGPKATYTNYYKDTPSTNAADWELDAIYWSKSWYVLTWRVVRDLVLGKYRKPRASDHDVVISSARI